MTHDNINRDIIETIFGSILIFKILPGETAKNRQKKTYTIRKNKPKKKFLIIIKSSLVNIFFYFFIFSVNSEWEWSENMHILVDEWGP